MSDKSSVSKSYSFTNSSGENLAGRLELPVNGSPRAFAIFAHCFTCSKNLNAVGHISRALAARGIAVLRFDFTGLGESEGDFADTSFLTNVDDLVKAAKQLELDYQPAKILIGHSLGGAAVLQAAADIASVEAVVTIGAPFDPRHVEHLLDSAKDEIVAEGEAVVNLAGRQFTIRKQFLDALASENYSESITTLGKPLLVMHSPIDNTVGVENAAAIYEAARHPKSFVSLDTADHLLSDEDDSRYVGTIVSAWVNRYIGTEDQVTANGKPTEKEVVATLGKNGYTTELMAGEHAIVADEPVSLGGANLGPTPYQLVSAGLASCTAITLRMYADRKEWPLEEVKVSVKHEKIHADDCDCETDQTGEIELMTRHLTFMGDLTDDQRKRLIVIANKCPVHKTLEKEVVVKTTVAQD